MPENTPETRPAGAVKTLVIEDVPFSFRWAPPGKFWMGSPETEVMRLDHETLHEVTIANGFWILATPVTQRQFMLTKKRNPAAFCSTGARRRYVVGLDTSEFPIENISWNAAAIFCRKLSQKLRKAKEPFYFDLPTEEEWEYACRAGTSTVFFWGDAWSPDKANCNASYAYPPPALPHPAFDALEAERLHPCCSTPVGSYPPNAWGIYDTHGNCYEWCADLYAGYDGKETEHGFPDARVLRGGCCTTAAWFARSACRASLWPDMKGPGFRVVLRDATPSK